MSMSSLAAAAELFHSLSDPSRLAIVRHIAHGEARVSDLAAELPLAQSTISAHVRCLVDCGVLEGRPDGRQVYYSIAGDEVVALLRSAEALLSATGYRIDLCPVHGVDARR